MADLLNVTITPRNSALNLLLFSGRKLAVGDIKDEGTFVTF